MAEALQRYVARPIHATGGLDFEAQHDKNGSFVLIQPLAGHADRHLVMVFEHIIKLQQEYTDRFVVVNQGIPELSRFEGMTGTVRTVNMSGRALVEFDGNLNIGWYDIDVDFLKVIEEPLPKEDPKAKAKAKSAGPKSLPKNKSAAQESQGQQPASDGKGKGK